MNKEERKKELKLILDLLANRTRDKSFFTETELMNSAFKKQWETASTEKKNREKKDIWKKISKKCHLPNPNLKIRIFQLSAACCLLAALLVTTGILFYNEKRSLKEIQVTAEKDMSYHLPDGSQINMEKGCTIRYIKDFTNNRKLWLTGNALFEVKKQPDHPFRVYFSKAFIEVKGTKFFVQQNKNNIHKITLFNGSIDFTIAKTGEKRNLKPMENLIYDARYSTIRTKKIQKIKWKNGKYVFNDIELELLLKIINKMYVTTIKLSPQMDKKRTLTGYIGSHEKLPKVIKKICYCLNLETEKRESRIILKTP